MIRFAIVVMAFAIAGSATAQPGAAPTLPALDGGRRAAIVDSLTAAIDTVYVFPEIAKTMVADVRTRLAAGEYDNIAQPQVFAERLTGDLRAICHDAHLGVRIQPPAPAAEREDPAVARARQLAEEQRDNFGFVKVERLAGNIGYLKLDGFSGERAAGPTAVAAMTFLGNCDAIIFDLTDNGGGSPAMIQLLTSYLLDESTHLNSFEVRATGEVQQFWSLPWVPGPQLADVPVYVLTSRRTFSAAEEFTYNLKSLERATIVGETTGGGAHPVNGHTFDFGDYVVFLSLPFGRAVNPITGTNWEGTGVAPHVACPADRALETAHLHALQTLAEHCGDPQRRYELDWARAGLTIRQNPVTLSSKQLDAFVGAYGPRKVRREGDHLVYQRGENPPLVMVPMGDDAFAVAQVEYFRMRFERDDRGRVVRLVGLYVDGRSDANERER